MKQISDTDLLLNTDESIYHLNLHPQEIADNIILVGDPDRVELIASLLDKKELKKQKREFFTVTGTFAKKRISIISTGIGTDNIDIVVNEIDALANIDFKKKMHKTDKRCLNFFRIGTCGSIQPDILPGSYIVSNYCIGFDNLMNFYQCRFENEELVLKHQIENHLTNLHCPIPFYLFSGTHDLINRFSNGFHHGITVSFPGFYGPQGRFLRTFAAFPDMINALTSFEYNHIKILNFEMETSAIYGLSRILDHHSVTIDLVIANRISEKANINYHDSIRKMAENVLQKISELP